MTKVGIVARPRTTPGEILKNEFLPRVDLTQENLADELQLSRLTINQLVNGRRSVTADVALRLSKFFGTTPQFWLNLQQAVDLERAQQQASEVLIKIRPVNLTGIG